MKTLSLSEEVPSLLPKCFKIVEILIFLLDIFSH